MRHHMSRTIFHLFKTSDCKKNNYRSSRIRYRIALHRMVFTRIHVGAALYLAKLSRLYLFHNPDCCFLAPAVCDDRVLEQPAPLCPYNLYLLYN